MSLVIRLKLVWRQGHQKGGHGSWSALGTLPGLVLTSGMLGSVSSEDNGHEDTTGGSSVHASICPLEKCLLNTSCVPGLSGRNDNYDGSPGPRDSAMFSPLSVSPTHLDAFHPVPPPCRPVTDFSFLPVRSPELWTHVHPLTTALHVALPKALQTPPDP